MGAIASGGVRVLNEECSATCRCRSAIIETVAERESASSSGAREPYRGSRPPLDVPGRRSSSSTTVSPPARRCARPCKRCGQMKPRAIVVAVPVAAPSTCDEFRAERRRDDLPRDAGAVPGGRPLVRGLQSDHATRKCTSCSTAVDEGGHRRDEAGIVRTRHRRACALEGNLLVPDGATRRRPLRARQRQQPFQLAQSLRGAGAPRRWPRHVADRSADGERRGGR